VFNNTAYFVEVADDNTKDSTNQIEQVGNLTYSDHNITYFLTTIKINNNEKVLSQVDKRLTEVGDCY
jgi:hypothetical protein